MSFEPDALQRLVLWRLALSEDGSEFVTEIDPSNLKPARRAPLVREGLVVEQKVKVGGKGVARPHLELTDKGWAWCQNHLGEAFKFRGSPPKLAGVVLERLLVLLQRYLQAQDHTTSFGDFVLQSHSQQTSSENAFDFEEGSNGKSNGVEGQVREVCRALANGRENTRIRIAELRDRIGVERSVLDATLLEMERSGELSLYELNDPRDIRDSDRDAALQTSVGNLRHVVYFGGQAS